MMNNKLLGRRLKVFLSNSGKTREKVVADVQDLIRPDGLSFSFAGLCKMLEGNLPKKDGEAILRAVAFVLDRKVSDFSKTENI